MLTAVHAPTLLIVGGADREVLELNHWAQALMRCPNQLSVVPGATHLFEEPGTLSEAAALARDWFVRYLVPGGSGESGSEGMAGRRGVRRLARPRRQPALQHFAV